MRPRLASISMKCGSYQNLRLIAEPCRSCSIVKADALNAGLALGAAGRAAALLVLLARALPVDTRVLGVAADGGALAMVKAAGVPRRAALHDAGAACRASLPMIRTAHAVLLVDAGLAVLAAPRAAFAAIA
jgi:hypothetical protein